MNTAIATTATIETTSAQAQFLRTKKPFASFVGGWWSGKTYIGVARLILDLIAQPGLEHCFWAPTMTLAKGKPFRLLQQQLERLGIRHKISKPQGEVLFDCGKRGSIWLRSYNRIESIRSFDAATQIVDEIDSLPKERAIEVWNQILGRSRGGVCPFIGSVSTPDAGKTGFLYEFFAVNAESNDVLLVHGRTNENIWEPNIQDYVDRVRSQLPSNLAEAYLGGQFVSIGQGRVYDQYNQANQNNQTSDLNDLNNQQTGQDQNIRVGVDFNIDACCAVVGRLTGSATSGNLHVYDELMAANTEELCQALLERYKGKRIWIYPDASGDARTTNATETDISILRHHRLNVSAPKRNPRIKNRVQTVNIAFNQGTLTVDPRGCPKLHEALLDHVYKNGEPVKSNTHPAHDDWNDALGYLVYQLLPVNPQVPSTNIKWRG